MPYFMVHLTIARELDKRYAFKDLGAFYLGSIAPDAILFRPGKLRSDKWYTHYCPGENDWGNLKENDAWYTNLINHRDRYPGDFGFGYCMHILTDIESNRRLYGPVHAKQEEAVTQAWVQDQTNAEAVLLGRIGDLEHLWDMLYAANRHELPGIITRDDITLMLDYMKDDLYAGMKPADDYAANIYTLQDFERFIKETVDICVKHY